MLAEKHHWDANQVNNLTLRQIRLYCMSPEEAREIGAIPKTRAGRKAVIDPAVANLLAGRRWDVR